MQNFLALGALPPDPQNSSLHCEFLAMLLDVSKQVKIYWKALFHRKFLSSFLLILTQI